MTCGCRPKALTTTEKCLESETQQTGEPTTHTMPGRPLFTIKPTFSSSTSTDSVEGRVASLVRLPLVSCPSERRLLSPRHPPSSICHFSVLAMNVRSCLCVGCVSVCVRRVDVPHCGSIGADWRCEHSKRMPATMLATHWSYQAPACACPPQRHAVFRDRQQCSYRLRRPLLSHWHIFQYLCVPLLNSGTSKCARCVFFAGAPAQRRGRRCRRGGGEALGGGELVRATTK